MPSAATGMYLDINTLSEISQKDKNIYHMISLICGFHSGPVIWHTWTIYKTEETHRHTGLTRLPRGEEGRDGLGAWDNQCKLLSMYITEPLFCIPKTNTTL